MKILVLTNNFIGAYNFRKEVLSAFLNCGNEVFVSAPVDEKAKDVGDLGCRIIKTHFNRKGTNPVRDFILFIKYVSLLIKLKPNIVLSYTIKPNLYGGMACKLCKIPQVANITGLGSAVETPGFLQTITILLYRLGLNNTRTVFFQNESNLRFFQEHKLLKGAFKLIPGSGVNLDFHSLQDYPRNDDIIRFVFISRLLKEKGIEEYFSAAERIVKRYPNTEFHVVGWCEDAYEDVLKEMEGKGIVIYHGPVKDVRPFIGMAHCTIHPSYYPEGLSNVLLESCAAGRPIITTDRPGCVEVVDDGINGFVVKQQNVNDLTEKIERFMLLPYEKKKEMGAAARLKVEQEFDRKIVIKAYIDEINANGSN